MNFNYFRLIFAATVAFLVSYASTPIVRLLAFKIGALDVPKDDRRMHKKPIPRIGGLAIFYGFIVAILCFCEMNRGVRGVLIGSVIIVALGFLDDVMSLRAWQKFIVQIIAALIVVAHGVTIDHFSNPNMFSDVRYISLGIWSMPVTVLWLVGVTNAINLIDGLDGLATGVSSISSITLIVVAVITGEFNLAVITAAIAGAGFGFLPYNMYPAKIFMGDTGSNFLGFLLGSISILGLFKSYAVISFAIPFLILALPIFDTSFAIVRRIARGQSPMSPDRGHLHHRLIDMGFNQKQSVSILCIASGLLSLSAVVFMLSGAFRAILLILSVFILVYLAVKLMIKNNESEDIEDAED